MKYRAVYKYAQKQHFYAAYELKHIQLNNIFYEYTKKNTLLSTTTFYEQGETYMTTAVMIEGRRFKKQRFFLHMQKKYKQKDLCI